MKKLMTIMTACLVAGLASAQVQSANIVGYNQVTLYPGFNFIGQNWQSLDGSDQIAISNLFDKTEVASNLMAGNSKTNSDNIIVWDPTTQGYPTTYFLSASKTGWVSGSLAPLTTNSMALGQGFWLYHRGVITNMTLSGQVKYSASATNELHLFESGFNLLSSGFTASMPLNDARWNWTGNVTAGNSKTNSDNIIVWDPSTQGYPTTYFYSASKTGWVSGSLAPLTTNAIPLGATSWYYRRGSPALVTEQQPY